MAKQKWYVVWQGREPGIYSNWEQCKQQIHGFDAALYKSFKTKQEAEYAFQESPYKHIGTKRAKPATLFEQMDTYNSKSLCVDAACSGNPGRLEYRGVWTEDGSVAFHSNIYPIGTNNLGEFLAIIDGIKHLIQENKEDYIIYTDSATAMAWIQNKKVKSTLERFPETHDLWADIDNAITYLNDTSHSISIQKWETEDWGEIHADFGRK